MIIAAGLGGIAAFSATILWDAFLSSGHPRRNPLDTIVVSCVGFGLVTPLAMIISAIVAANSDTSHFWPPRLGRLLESFTMIAMSLVVLMIAIVWSTVLIFR